jgi:septum formation protein
MGAPPLILASASPRRKQLLADAGVAFEILPADVDESVREGERPVDTVARLASAKALAVARRVGARPRRRVLGADTIVVLDGAILGKPRDPRHAAEILQRLVGRRHAVITAVAIADSETLALHTAAITSHVQMRPASRDEIARYVDTGEPLDKAGAYAIQGAGRTFVTALVGSESNVIGLPMDETLALLIAADAGGPTA